jgi:hypothetical protein
LIINHLQLRCPRRCIGMPLALVQGDFIGGNTLRRVGS